MSIFDFFDEIGKVKTSIIIYCLLNRIPLIISGRSLETIDDLIVEISDLIPFRKDLIFGTDFISEEEYNNLINIELLDYNSLRSQISCPTCVSERFLNSFSSFSSMIMGLEIKDKEHLNIILKRLKKSNCAYFLIKIGLNGRKNDYYGINQKNIDLSIEKLILRKVSDNTKKAIIRMKRVLSEKVKKSDLEEDILNTILDFKTEKVELQKNILKKEIQNFYSGCKRGFFILSRLELLNNLTYDAKIGFNTLKETIDFHDISPERIILFIKKEWGENYSHLIENDKMINLSEKIQSLWG
jgi:hypothetical protein